MTLKIELDPPDEALLIREAARQGLTADEYVRHLIERSLIPQPGTSSVEAARSGQELARAFRAWAESYPADTPLLSGEAISREIIYGARA